jgi:UDP-glucose 4-epimerase
MHILITGGAGFIGSHLTGKFLDRGDSVTVVDDYSTGRADNLLNLRNHPNLTLVESDLTNSSEIDRLVQSAETVYHLAAAVGVALIAAQPRQTIERNIYPTQLLLESVTKKQAAGQPTPMFLASTSEVYGKNPKSIWSEEDDLVFGATTKPRWSYGCSKAIDEFMALACYQETQLPIVIGRFFNVVGPRQTGAYGMVLPRFVAAALAGSPLVVHDDGLQQRCFAHVHDILDAVVKLVEQPSAHGQVYNIGSDTPITIVDLAKRVIKLIGSRSEIQYQTYSDAYNSSFEDIRRRVPDLTRIQTTIGFHATKDIDAIIRDVAEEMTTSPT